MKTLRPPYYEAVVLFFLVGLCVTSGPQWFVATVLFFIWTGIKIPSGIIKAILTKFGVLG